MAKASTAVARKSAGAIVDMVALRKQLQEDAATIAGRITAGGGDRINVNQSKSFTLPHGGEVDELDGVVIVDFISANYFYRKGYKKGEISPPVCFALNPRPADMAPSKGSKEPQAKTCAVCPQNQFPKSGGPKPCQNTRLLAVLPKDANEDTPIAVLKVSPTAIRQFDAYVGQVARLFEVSPIGVSTRVTFDEKLDYPSLRFGGAERLEDSKDGQRLLALALSRREEARARLMTEPNTNVDEGSSSSARRKR